MKYISVASAVVLFLCIGFFSLQETNGEKMVVVQKAPKQPVDKVVLSEEEWKKKLTPEQYRVARRSGTEPAGGEVYKQFNKQGEGVYYCIGCDAELFTSKEKLDAKSGWPSFFDMSKPKNIKTVADYSYGVERVEVKCSVCDSHLGHVFTGEGFDTPTDKRYCINGVVLKFVPKSPDSTNNESAEAKSADASKEADKTDKQ